MEPATGPGRSLAEARARLLRRKHRQASPAPSDVAMMVGREAEYAYEDAPLAALVRDGHRLCPLLLRNVGRIPRAPLEEALKRRVELVTAVLTIVRAYLAAGEPRPDVRNFAGFKDWCRFVRYPLIWLGMADPCEGRERIEWHDPVREQLIALLTAWHDVFGSKPVKVADEIKEATRDSHHGESEAKLDARNALHEALAQVGGRSGHLSTAVGHFIRRNATGIEGGLRFEKAGGSQNAVAWRVKMMDGHSHTTSKGEVVKVVTRVRLVRMVRLNLSHPERSQLSRRLTQATV